MVNKEWFRFVQLVCLGIMVIVHLLLVFGVEISGFGLPVMALGIGLGAAFSKDKERYLMRMLVASFFAQIFWLGAGLRDVWSSDLLSLTLGLVGALIEQRIKYAGWLVLVVGWFGGMQLGCIVLVLIGYHFREDLLGWSVVVFLFGLATSWVHGWQYLAYCFAGPVLLLGRWLRSPLNMHVGRWLYVVYPGHLAGISFIRGC